MAMSTSYSISSPSLSISLHKTHPKTLILSLLSSPNLKKTHRKNHLRPKLPPKKPILDPPLFIPPTPQEDTKHSKLEFKSFESFEEIHKNGVAEVLESVHEVTLESQNPKSLILDLSFRFAALIAVQTAVALWIFSRGERKNEEKNIVGAAEGGVGKKEEDLDFERAVLEIRNMAKEARGREAKEREENEIESEGLFLKSDRVGGSENGKFGSRKKLGFVKENATRYVAKGFSGVQQIAHQNPRQKTVVLSELTEKSADVESSSVLLNEKPSHVVDLHNSQVTKEKSASDHKASPINHKSSSMNGKSKFRSRHKVVVAKSMVNSHKNGSFDSRKKPWWLKLPFVLAILMRRGPDRNSPKGLYSLDNGDFGSYTICFQDQGDATNFCYLLEYFFEELEGFSADIVPLTIKELEEGLRSNEINVIVVRKGQLQLYAGQPLTEVETALRFLLD